MTHELFSHPESHESQAQPGSSDPEQRTWTNLFQEPAPAPESTESTA